MVARVWNALASRAALAIWEGFVYCEMPGHLDQKTQCDNELGKQQTDEKTGCARVPIRGGEARERRHEIDASSGRFFRRKVIHIGSGGDHGH
jgi:hypothetical protein